ncbi:MAG: S-layer homology domain-containing protein, partial [Actinomycetota bacterium]|nr:S-layer homology domain-containing protein [Actinomycetota bacterium]
RNHLGVFATLVLMSVATAITPAAGAKTPADNEVLLGPDFSTPVVAPPDGLTALTTQGMLDDDPLGLVPKLPFVQRYSLDTDHFEVWLCGNTGYTMEGAIAALEAANSNYFAALSGGRYDVVFSAGGSVADPQCLANQTISPSGTSEGVFIIDDHTAGGYASPGTVCLGDSNCDWIGTTYPANGRYAVVGSGVLASLPSVATHELGHTLQWPHSNSGESEYDNPIDLMSGNTTIGGWTDAEPYGSLAFNRYQSGWIDTSDVVMASVVYQEVTLQPFDAPGTQLIVVPTAAPGVFYTLGTRVQSAIDLIPAEWEGVEVYKVDHDCGISGFDNICPGIWREQLQEPPNPDGVAHVLQPGEGIVLEGIQIDVTSRNGSGFTVAVGDPSNVLPFADIAASLFVDDISWLVDESITRGCNPPVNTRYCPTGSVTRGEMAAFLVRTLGLTDDGGGNKFTDDDGSVFEDDIANLAAAGITRGCNPPDNTRFCPYDRVTRQQMAAFLVRAYGFTDDGGGNTFTDDDGSIFEDDIAKLATEGVTMGCNPPANSEFCPYESVTREQMAAFLHRATGAK